ncbi:MAG: hypothetical protein KAI71_05115 [Candidatus Pacebacteria bacterium]|nr:hypothetical protein [Candidatus Paceibacterota bacterium]
MNGNGQIVIPETDILELVESLMNKQDLPTNQTMTSLGDGKPLLMGCIPSKRKAKWALKHNGTTLLKTPQQVVEEFRKKLKEMKSPGITIVGKNGEVEQKVEQRKVFPEKRHPVLKAPEHKSSRPPMVWTKPEGDQSGLMWVVFKRKILSNREEIISAEARCNGKKVWVKPKVPLEKEGLGYLRPIRIPWWEIAEFDNVFIVELPDFSEKRVQMGDKKVIVIESSVYFSQDILQKKGPFAVLFKEDLVLIHIDKRLKEVYHALNTKQKEENGVGDQWTILRNGLLRSPEKSRISDETVLEVLKTVLEK